MCMCGKGMMALGMGREGGGGLEDLGKESPPPEHFPRSCEVIPRHPCRYVVVRSDAGKIFT